MSPIVSTTYDITGFTNIDVFHETIGTFGYMINYIVGISGIAAAPLLLSELTVFLLPTLVVALTIGMAWLTA